jgi:hypothetical protein
VVNVKVLPEVEVYSKGIVAYVELVIPLAMPPMFADQGIEHRGGLSPKALAQAGGSGEEKD